MVRKIKLVSGRLVFLEMTVTLLSVLVKVKMCAYAYISTYSLKDNGICVFRRQYVSNITSNHLPCKIFYEIKLYSLPTFSYFENHDMK